MCSSTQSNTRCKRLTWVGLKRPSKFLYTVSSMRSFHCTVAWKRFFFIVWKCFFFVRRTERASCTRRVEGNACARSDLQDPSRARTQTPVTSSTWSCLTSVTSCFSARTVNPGCCVATRSMESRWPVTRVWRMTSQTLPSLASFWLPWTREGVSCFVV